MNSTSHLDAPRKPIVNPTPDIPVETIKERAVFAARALAGGQAVMLSDASVLAMAEYIRSLHPL